PSSCRNRRRERLAPFERRSQFARISERLLAIEEQRVEIDRRNMQLLEAYTSRSQERDSALAQALLAIGDGLKLLADAVKK
ncbi:jg21361, partial [Pararge aegeria aegeria]